MKNFIWLLLALIVFQSCKKHDDTSDPRQEQGTLVILKVDYLTHKFEGGHVFKFDNIEMADSIPLKTIYKSPSDFGGITLMYTPGNDTVLSGSIIWSGTGQLNYPVLSPVSAFAKDNFVSSMPDSAKIQYVNKTMYPTASPANMPDIWSGISNLTLVQDYLATGSKVGLFLYQPSIGVGNPSDWDWYWILYRKLPPVTN